MSKFSKRSYTEEFSSVILDIAALAKKDRLSGNNIIDGSIGAFYGDDGLLVSIPQVKQALKNGITDNLGYGNVSGPEEFKQLMLKWFLKDYYTATVMDYYIPFCATVGGTGAVSAANYLFLDQGETILLPDIMWGNYTLIAKKSGLKYDCYKLFSGSNFNADSLIEKVEKLKSVQNSIAIVINDPCHNPTGYCMNEEEYRKLYSRLDALSDNCNITVLIDIAYIDYDTYTEKMHTVFKCVLEKNYNFNIVFLFSCSKSFGVYGARIGGIFTFTKDKEYEKIFLNSFKSFARGMYSSPNTAAISAICNVLNGDIGELRAELKKNSSVLIERGKKVSSLLENKNIRHYAYKNGFFITIITNGVSKPVCETLRKEHIYLVPVDENNIRISLSNISVEKTELLVDSLKKAIDKCS